MEEYNNKNLENLENGTYKGFYAAFKKFNDNPELYFKYK